MTLPMQGILLALAFALAASAARAQPLVDRLLQAGDGVIRMEFAARAGVCGDGGGMISSGRTRHAARAGDRAKEWESACEPGPVRVAIDMSNGTVAGIRSYVGGRWRAGGPEVTDWGRVAAPSAAELLIHLARTASGRAAAEAILPAVLADSAVVWRGLAALARDSTRPREVRRHAVFWLGQAAGDAATGTLDSIATDVRGEREIREQAIFALSQRPRDEGVPALIRIARTNRDPELRRKAFFWLGQTGDPRALALFEEILTGR